MIHHNENRPTKIIKFPERKTRLTNPHINNLEAGSEAIRNFFKSISKQNGFPDMEAIEKIPETETLKKDRARWWSFLTNKERNIVLSEETRWVLDEENRVVKIKPWELADWSNTKKPKIRLVVDNTEKPEKMEE